jgi:HD-GYP domain-containing protein (c-di-GMP phosphodiesterase class II)
LYRRIPISMLTAGFVLTSAVHDDDRRLLLAPGVSLSHEFILSLGKRGVRDVVVAEKDWRRLNAFTAQGNARAALPGRAAIQVPFHTDGSLSLDRQSADWRAGAIVAADDPFTEQVRKHGSQSYSRDDIAAMLEHYDRSVEFVGATLNRLKDGESVAAEALQATTQESLLRASDDLDLFTCMGINPSETTEISAHSMNTAILAMAIGATLGQDAQTLVELGVGCLVHDVGMLKVDRKLYTSKEYLDSRDFVEVAKHPIVAADMLHRNLQQVPLGVRMIVYQMHERCDGSGYPRGRTSESIHPLAKIAAVADVYVALVSKRPHRPAMLPYFAVTKMLEDVKAGLFDPQVVRALLQTISLFPLGSIVELNDGRVAKTVRSNGPAYDRPIVEAWARTALNAPPELIDLGARQDLKICKPLTSLR